MRFSVSDSVLNDPVASDATDGVFDSDEPTGVPQIHCAPFSDDKLVALKSPVLVRGVLLYIADLCVDRVPLKEIANAYKGT